MQQTCTANLYIERPSRGGVGGRGAAHGGGGCGSSRDAAGLGEPLDGLQLLAALVEEHVRAVRPVKLWHLHGGCTAGDSCSWGENMLKQFTAKSKSKLSSHTPHIEHTSCKRCAGVKVNGCCVMPGAEPASLPGALTCGRSVRSWKPLSDCLPPKQSRSRFLMSQGST